MTVHKENRNKIQQQLKKWQERLLDLSKSNPLLRLNQSRVSKLKVVEPETIKIFTQLVIKEKHLVLPHIYRTRVQPTMDGFISNQKSELVLEKGDIVFEEDIEKIHRKLRRIYDTARTSIQERGVITLHLSFGILNWTDEQYGNSLSPLILIPCEIESHAPHFSMELKKADQEIQLNQALSLVLQKKFSIKFEELNEEVLLEKGGLNSWWEFLRQQIKQKNLDWTITDEVWLTNYSFESLVLVQDLSTLSEVAYHNPIVAAIAKVSNPINSRVDISENDLDKLETPEKVPVPVLPCDSSQLKSLTLARSGNHLVIHGPPGTGKSQTICNLIADALCNQKKVLFVSAKMAALEVVHRRLVQLGLDQFCLEAHSTKAGKATIIGELQRTLSSAEEAYYESNLDKSLKDFEKIRKELNKYVELIHTKNLNLELSIYEAIGKIEKMKDVYNTNASIPWNNLSDVRKDDLEKALDKLELFSHFADIYYNADKHPWQGLILQENGNISRTMISESLTYTSRRVKDLVLFLNKIPQLVGNIQLFTICRVQNVFRLINELLSSGDPVPQWFLYDSEQLFDIEKSIQNAEQITRLMIKNISEHRKRWKITPEELIPLLKPVEQKYVSRYRNLRPDYWYWRYKVSRSLKKGIRINLEEIVRSLKTAQEISKARLWYQQNHDSLIKKVGLPIQFQLGWLAEIQCRIHLMAEYKAILESFSDVHLSSSVYITQEIKNDIEKINTILTDEKFLSSLETISKLWPNGFYENLKIDETPLSSIIEQSDRLIRSIDSVEEWIAFQKAKALCDELKLMNFIEDLEDGLLPDVVNVFEKKFLVNWVSTMIARSEDLIVFKGEWRENKITQFQEFNKELEKSWLTHVKYNASIPARNIAMARNDLGNSSEVAILRRELQKQRRYKPLRKLFSEIPNVLTALKPCMLMSPVSVSTFLMPEKFQFDIVIFDEASQLLTPEAIPAILRSKQVIVAGDSKQLPPTSFFMASSLFDLELGENDEIEEDFLESLLDDCVSLYPIFDQTYLRWHYRSRDERLIAFSNHYFYNDKPLITFPSVFIDENSEEQGVRLIYLNDGFWDRGNSRTNIAEAKKVIEVLRENIIKHPERSLGIVTMNVSQRELIEELLDNLFINEPDLGEKIAIHAQEPLFVKTLENVQGDERDTIIISTGYGKTIDGSFSYNFGPINKEGGWRRLNVLITRARFHTILVTSLRSTELGNVNPNNLGALALRNFIDYAERGCKLPSSIPVITHAETNDFEDSVADELKKIGYHVDQQVGVGRFRIDLAIRDPRNPNLYLLGIECDGATYHSTPTARDRDIIREKILNEMGWSIHRVWSTDWFRNRVQTLNRITEAIQQSMKGEGTKYPFAPPEIINTSIPPKTSKKKTRKIELHRKYKAGQPYQEYSINGDRKYLLNEGFETVMRDQIFSIIQTEGPIHIELLKKRLIELNHIGRIGDRISSRVEKTINFLVEQDSIYKDNKNFLKLPNHKLSTFRSPLNYKRPIEWVSDEEISLAICYIIEDQVSFIYDELPKAIAKLFGWERSPNTLSQRIDELVKGLLSDKILIQKDNKLLIR